MSNLNIRQCRLCSSLTNLISMFSGKSKTIRDFLRKMIHKTINIQILGTDTHTAVCFNCLVDISNFYLFKLLCVENEKQFKDNVESPIAKKQKLSSVPLENIDEPDIGSTETVLNWLKSKRSDTINSENTSKRFAEKECQSYLSCVDAFTQYDVDCRADPAQTENRISNSTLLENIHETDIVSNNSTIKQLSRKERLSSQQYSDVSTQCEGVSSHSRHSQTRFVKVVEICDISSKATQTIVNKSKTKNSVSQTDLKQLHGEANYTNKEIQCDISSSLVKDLHQNESSNGFDAKLLGKQNQTDKPKSVSSQCDIINLNNIYLKDPFMFSSDVKYSREIDSKLNVKVSFKEEIISPVECLNIAIPPKCDQLSPNMADLLQVKSGKSDYVHICKICDKTLYNKAEVSRHNKTHMQCPFCRKKFRSFKATNEHGKDCHLKQIFNLPVVQLARIDNQESIRNEYPYLFKSM